MAKDPLTVAEVASRSGFAPSALRFYEAKGLIEASRTSGRQRRYARGVLGRLAFIRLAPPPEGRTPNGEDWQRISEDWRARLDEQIGAIEALRDRLDGCIGCGCLFPRDRSLFKPEGGSGAP